MSQDPLILLIEDTPSLAMLYRQYLAEEPVQVVSATTGAEGLDVIRNTPPAVVLLDLELPDMNGLEILKYIQANQLPSSVVVITAHGSVNIAVEAMRTGAYDFIVKPFNANRLRVTVNNALERQKLSQMVMDIQAGARESYAGFIGKSLAMQAIYRIIESAANSKATVFITGESGTGKEVCAQAIHKQSERSTAPFVAINCGAIPRELMESEIFGHRKGAFTGATSDRDGAATAADGGTLFLDEIGEMPMDLQTKLLRFIQTGTFQKVGATKTEKVDVRFVCATNRDVLREVERGNFREDLYYRLHVIPIAMPPLRERDDDVLHIARELLREISEEEGRGFQGFSAEVEQIFLNYSWPGNVRELQNVLRNVVVLNTGTVVTAEMLPTPMPRVLHQTAPGRPAITGELPAATAQASHAYDNLTGRTGTASGQADPTPSSGEATILPLWQVERKAIENAIRQCDGNIPKAAKLLDVAPSTIYRKKVAWEGKGR
ncbi:sigma-54-dependent transcriptional regulator [Aestuariispira ectoiniformans]|uniref:sigma-54-dependent transcriptional regulator n=1 Tax=Aestuariispira ectoiniformans TaxID=2775080 RepID=UPI00223B8C94|nr:sigma-54 dependent transcriptional regulator [Aestuariispira ectoiniformans]